MISGCSLVEQTTRLPGSFKSAQPWQEKHERADKKNVSQMGIHQVEEFSEDKKLFPYTGHT